MSEFLIEVGKYYVTGLKKIYGPMELSNRQDYTFRCSTTGETFTSCGKIHVGQDSPGLDLESELVERPFRLEFPTYDAEAEVYFRVLLFPENTKYLPDVSVFYYGFDWNFDYQDWVQTLFEDTDLHELFKLPKDKFYEVLGICRTTTTTDPLTGECHSEIVVLKMKHSNPILQVPYKLFVMVPEEERGS